MIHSIRFNWFVDADGELEHILPVCMDKKCVDSRIYVRDDNTVSIEKREKIWKMFHGFSGINYRLISVMENDFLCQVIYHLLSMLFHSASKWPIIISMVIQILLLLSKTVLLRIWFQSFWKIKNVYQTKIRATTVVHLHPKMKKSTFRL